MKRFIILALALALLFACSKEAGKESGKGKVYAEKDAVPGGTLVIGVTGEADSFSPLTALSQNGRNVISLVFRRLADINDDLETFSPQLAKAWDISEDRLTITFHLRTDASWHDGTRFSSKDVLFTYKKHVDPEIAWDGAYYKEGITGVEAPDDSTIVFRFVKRSPTNLMDAVEGYILPAHIFEGMTASEIVSSDFYRQPVGTGPFRFVEWKSQQSVTLARYDGYYEEGKPRLDRVIFRVMPDEAGLWRQVQAGDLDMMEGVPPREFARLEKQWREGASELQPYSYLGRRYDFIGWNLLDRENWARQFEAAGEGTPEIEALLVPNSLFGSKKVREALTMALDRETIAQVANNGLAVKIDGPVPPILWAYDESANRVLPYDPVGAKNILAEEGWSDTDGDGIIDKNGMKFNFTMTTNAGDQVREHALTMIQEQLKTVGVQMTPQVAESGLLRQMLGTRDFDAVLIGWNVSLKMDFDPLFHTGSFFIPFHFTGYYSKDYDMLSADAVNEVDRETAKLKWNAVAKLLSEDLPYTWLYYQTDAVALHSRFKGVKIDVRGPFVNIEDWWIPEAERKTRDLPAGR